MTDRRDASGSLLPDAERLTSFDHRLLRLDLSILARTVKQVVSGHGVSAPDHATMEPFRGPGS